MLINFLNNIKQKMGIFILIMFNSIGPNERREGILLDDGVDNKILSLI